MPETTDILQDFTALCAESEAYPFAFVSSDEIYLERAGEC